MLTANNVFAKITRAYNLNGSLAADTERVRESDSASAVYSHIYGTRYGYDLEGRRSWLKHPATVAALNADSVAYAYDALSGMLKSVRDPYGNRFGFSYDAALRLSSDTATMTTGTVLLQTRSYDYESRLVGHRELQNGTTFIQDSLFYDARNKEVAATFLSGGAPASESNVYTSIGALARHVSPSSHDTVITDALGHQRTHASELQGYSSSTMSYDASGSAELKTVIGARSAGYKDTTSNSYDLAGSLWTSTVRHEVATSGPGHPRPYFTRVRTWSRYGSNLQLMATETLFDTVDAVGVYPPVTYYEREEYRYDALGRRIWRRLIRPSLCSKMNYSSGCLSVVERTVWDGDQVLWDIRADGGDGVSAANMEVDGTGVRTKPSLEGRVFYTHGPGIDHPLSIGRLDANATVIVPEYDYKGNAISGYCTAGTLCTQLEWPEKLESPWDQDPPPVDGPTVWGGGLIDTHKDGSGYVYMRNRYYDPSSGRFTQTDPIGLGGGLNAYGFAGGDPVNYDDPFGLTPWWTAAAVAARILASTSVAANTAEGYLAAGGSAVAKALRSAIERTDIKDIGPEDLESQSGKVLKSSEGVGKELSRAGARGAADVATESAPEAIEGVSSLTVGVTAIAISAAMIVLTPERPKLSAHTCKIEVCDPDSRADPKQ